MSIETSAKMTAYLMPFAYLMAFATGALLAALQ